MLTGVGATAAVSDRFGGPEVEELAERAVRDGFVTMRPDALGSLMSAADLESLRLVWDDLPLDTALGDGQHYRRRRYGRLKVSVTDTSTMFEVLQHMPFRQDGIALWQGRDRVFAAAAPEVLLHPGMCALVCLDARIATAASGITSWHVGVHLIRVIADQRSAGQPTPEGRHRDGHLYIGMHLLRRERCAGGVSTLYPDNGDPQRWTLREPLDSMFVDDAKVTHEVSPITAVDDGGVRDMLLVDLNPAQPAADAG